MATRRGWYYWLTNFRSKSVSRELSRNSKNFPLLSNFVRREWKSLVSGKLSDILVYRGKDAWVPWSEW